MDKSGTTRLNNQSILKMSDSERTFADRLGRARNLSGAISGFEPAFSPARAELSPEGFEEFLDEIGVLNRDTSAKVKDYTLKVNQRVEVVTLVKARVLQACDYVESDPDWRHHLPGLLSLKNKIRGYRASRPKPPVVGEDEDSPTVRARSLSEQGYAEIEGNFSSFIEVLKTVDGYAPPAKGIRLVVPDGEEIPSDENDPDLEAKKAELSLVFLLEWLSGLNRAMSLLGTVVKRSQRERYDKYEGELGLKDRKKRIKKAVSGQYGKQSSQFKEVKGIRV